MTKSLYIFGYESPVQSHNAKHGWDDEGSAAVFIIASPESEALEWGKEISENFIKQLFDDDSVSWKQLDFAHWIETHPESRFDSKALSKIPVVSKGELADFQKWM